MWKLLKGGFDAELNFNCLQIKAYKREREIVYMRSQIVQNVCRLYEVVLFSKAHLRIMFTDP